MVQCMKFDCEKINPMSTAQTQTDLVIKAANIDTMWHHKNTDDCIKRPTLNNLR